MHIAPRLLVVILLLLPTQSHAEDNANSQKIPQDRLVYITTDKGLIVLELAPFMAPKHVAQFTSLVAEGFYDGLDFYRVIDGFVAQAGAESEQKLTQHGTALSAEFTRTVNSSSSFILVQSPDFLAEQTGFIEGFPAGRSDKENLEWLLHCPGAVGMARDQDADSGSTDFYIVIGQAPRHLDRNMSIFAQVVYGLDNVQAIKRGDGNINGGVIENKKQRSKIIQAQLGTALDKSLQLSLTRDLVQGEAFQQRLSSARSLDNEFFHYKGAGRLDVCYYKPRTMLTSEKP